MRDQSTAGEPAWVRTILTVFALAAALGGMGAILSPADRAPAPLPALSGEAAARVLEQEGLRTSLDAAVETARYAARAVPSAGADAREGTLAADNPRHGFTTEFAKDGVHVVPVGAGGGGSVRLSLGGYGRGERIARVEGAGVARRGDGTRVEITRYEAGRPHAPLVEWYENSAAGLEQGWTLLERPEGGPEDGAVRLLVDLGGDLTATMAQDHQSLGFVDASGTTVFRYDGLRSWDSDGRPLTSSMQLVDDRLAIVVDDAGARYPVTVDPTITRTESRRIAGGNAQDREFGSAVAISGDTAVVGLLRAFDFGDSSGAAYVFRRDVGGTDRWGEVARLTASDGEAHDLFGQIVAISGSTIVVGAPGDDDTASEAGAVYIFERDQGGSDAWGQVRKIPSPDSLGRGGQFQNPDLFGATLALSGDTLVVGADGNEPGDLAGDALSFDDGAAYVFDRNTGGAGAWGLVAKLVASDAHPRNSFGSSVAVSADTAIVGAINAFSGVDGDAGRAYVFDRDQGGTGAWGEVRMLTAGPAAASQDFFGRPVAVSGDTAFVAASREGTPGVVYVFDRDTDGADAWGRTTTLTDPDSGAGSSFGFALALAGDVALIGYNPESASQWAYMFRREAGEWLAGDKLTSSIAPSRYGVSLAIAQRGGFSARFATAIVGDYDRQSAYLYDLPSVTDGFLFPTAVRARAGRSLIVRADFDVGRRALDLANGATIVYGAEEVVVPAFVPNSSGSKWTYVSDDGALKAQVSLSADGATSRGRMQFTVKGWDADLPPLQPAGELLRLGLRSGEVDVGADVQIEKKHYRVFSQLRADAAVCVRTVQGRVSSSRPSRVQVFGTFPSDGTVPAEAPAVRVLLGAPDAPYEAVVPDDRHSVRASRRGFRWQMQSLPDRTREGITLLALDYVSGTYSVTFDGPEIGTFSDGPAAFLFGLGLDEEPEILRIVVTSRGGTLNYR